MNARSDFFYFPFYVFVLSLKNSSHSFLNYGFRLASLSLREIGEVGGEKSGKIYLINFHSRGSYSMFLVVLHSERICIEHPNRINLNSLFAQISSRPSYFRLMYQLSEWRCKCDFSSATNSILRLKKVWFDFFERGKSN